MVQSTETDYLNQLRAFACICVVLLHSTMNYTNAGTSDPFAFAWGNPLNSLSRVGVPLFVMISGSLMLDENRAVSFPYIGKKIARLASFFLFYSVCYALAFTVGPDIVHHRRTDLLDLLWVIIAGHFHLWFIPMIIGLYLLIPILRLWVKQENLELCKYYLLLSFLFQYLVPHIVKVIVPVFPVFEHVNLFFDSFKLSYVLGWPSYFILGGVLRKEKQLPINRFALMAISFISCCCTIAGNAFVVFLEGIQGDSIFYSNFSVNVLICSASIFLLFSQKKSGYSRFHVPIDVISRNSFGIYGLHMFAWFIVTRFTSSLHPVIGIAVTFLFTFYTSLFISILMRKTPFFRKFV